MPNRTLRRQAQRGACPRLRVDQRSLELRCSAECVLVRVPVRGTHGAQRAHRAKADVQCAAPAGWLCSCSLYSTSDAPPPSLRDRIPQARRGFARCYPAHNTCVHITRCYFSVHCSLRLACATAEVSRKCPSDLAPLACCQADSASLLAAHHANKGSAGMARGEACWSGVGCRLRVALPLSNRCHGCTYHRRPRQAVGLRSVGLRSDG